MPIIPFKDLHLGGVSASKRSGIPNSIPRMMGWNLHDDPGLLQVNQKMTKDSSTSIDALCKVSVEASTGIKYWFSATSGKIWRENAGAYDLVYTTVPAAGGAGCLGAAEYQGFIYWATESRLHRIAVGSASNAAAWTANAAANWATFTNTDDTYHPMKEVNLVLYIGDKNYVAQVDAGTFSANALDIKTPYRISALAKQRTDLLIGTTISTSVNKCSVYRWNTWSVSFSAEDELDENGINCFIEADNFILINAGQAGNLYSWNGNDASFYKRIPGTYSPTATAKINPQAYAMFKGYPIFGVSNVSGNPCDQGVWSLGRHDPSYPLVLNLEFPTSNVDGSSNSILTGIEIGAIMVSGVNVYISWSYNDGSTTTYGVDKLDYTAKIPKPFMEFRLISIDRRQGLSLSQISAAYEALPANTSIVFKHKANHAASFSNWGDGTAIDDTQRFLAITEQRIEGNVIQPKMEVVTSGNNAPKIEEINIVVD